MEPQSDNATTSAPKKAEEASNLTSQDLDALSIAQSNALLEEQKKFPLIGERVKITESLLPEFQASNNVVLVQKTQALGTGDLGFQEIRRIRRDGSCFIRASCFRLFEMLLLEKQSSEVQLFLTYLKSLRPHLKGQFGEYVEDFCEVTEAIVHDIGNGTIKDSEALLARVTDETVSEYIICYWRYCMSHYIRTHADDFSPYLLYGTTVDDFCSKEVECVGTECDQLHITAWSQLVNMPMAVVYMDASPLQQQSTMDGANSPNVIRFGEAKANTFPALALLYRPGHYDVLYK